MIVLRFVLRQVARVAIWSDIFRRAVRRNYGWEKDRLWSEQVERLKARGWKFCFHHGELMPPRPAGAKMAAG